MIEFQRYMLEHPEAGMLEVHDALLKTMKVKEAQDTCDNREKNQRELRELSVGLSDKVSLIEEQLNYILHEFEQQIAAAYPPRQGSDRDREIMRTKLKAEHAEYETLNTKFKELKIQQQEVRFQLEQETSRATEAHIVLRQWTEYVRFITEYFRTKSQ